MGPTPVAMVGLSSFWRPGPRCILPEVDTSGTASRGPLLSAPAVLSRVLVVAILALCIGAVYAALPVGVGALVGWGANTALSVAAAAVVAVGFGPARRRIERWVQRLVYGDRLTPYEVLAELSDSV